MAVKNGCFTDSCNSSFEFESSAYEMKWLRQQKYFPFRTQPVLF